MLFKIVPFGRMMAERFPDNLDMAERYVHVTASSPHLLLSALILARLVPIKGTFPSLVLASDSP